MCSALGFVRWVFYLESSQSPIEMNEKQKKQKTCFRAAWMNGCDAMWASCLSHTHDIYAAHALSFERGLVFFFKVYNAFSGCEFVSFTSVHCVRASNILSNSQCLLFALPFAPFILSQAWCNERNYKERRLTFSAPSISSLLVHSSSWNQ